MTVGAVDSEVYGELFATAAMRAAFGDRARLQRMLDVEAALARVQARLGLIPAAAAVEITAKAEVGRFDVEKIRAGTELAGYPIVPLVFVAASLAIVVNQFASEPREAAIGLGVVALGAPIYYYLRHAHH